MWEVEELYIGCFECGKSKDCTLDVLNMESLRIVVWMIMYGVSNSSIFSKTVVPDGHIDLLRQREKWMISLAPTIMAGQTGRGTRKGQKWGN